MLLIRIIKIATDNYKSEMLVGATLKFLNLFSDLLQIDTIVKLI